MELYKGENQVIKSEMKLVREGQATHQATLQQQKEALDRQLQEHQADRPDGHPDR